MLGGEGLGLGGLGLGLGPGLGLGLGLGLGVVVGLQPIVEGHGLQLLLGIVLSLAQLAPIRMISITLFILALSSLVYSGEVELALPLLPLLGLDLGREHHLLDEEILRRHHLIELPDLQPLRPKLSNTASLPRRLRGRTIRYQKVRRRLSCQRSLSQNIKGARIQSNLLPHRIRLQD